MEKSTFLSSFQVGDLVTPKHHPGAPLAIVISTECISMFNRIQIQFVKSDRPEMANPEHWEVVSRSENRPENR